MTPRRRTQKLTLAALAAAIVLGGGWLARTPLTPLPVADGESAIEAVPVEVASITRGPLEHRRMFSGSIEAVAEFTVVTKVTGRIRQISVDLADPITRGQLLVLLDDEEFQQAVEQAKSELEVTRAEQLASEHALETAVRLFERVASLHQRGIASQQELDVAEAERRDREGAVQVARSRVERANAALRGEEIHSSYTRIHADWPHAPLGLSGPHAPLGPSGPANADLRFVSGRHVDPGQTVAANTPLLSIVDLDPVVAVFHVTEGDYARLKPGQSVRLRTDAYPNEVFAAAITRISPIFDIASRQARVEVRAENPLGRLKPGLFVRAEVVLDRVEDATSVPLSAIVVRDGVPTVLVVDDDGHSVSPYIVELGIRDLERVQVSGLPVSGQVVTLGHKGLELGTPITIIPSHAS